MVYFHHMMKSHESGQAFAIRAVSAARNLLDRVPHLEICTIEHEQWLGRGHCIDVRIDFRHGDGTHALIIETKPDGAPRFVRSAVYQLKGYLADLRESGLVDAGTGLIPMLASRYLSPQSRSICIDHDIAYLDLIGNARLAFGSVYIDQAVPDRPKSETRALKSIFAPKAAAILRVLLRDPDRPWRVVDLAEAAGASLGHVSSVSKSLLAREWIERQREGIVLVQPDKLLRTWRKKYRHPAGRRIRGYTRFHGDQLRKMLRAALNRDPGSPRAVCSMHSAADWIAPFGRVGTHSFYADERGARTVEDTLELSRVGRGANVVVCIPNDESLFGDAVEPAPGVFCTSPVVTYLDLWKRKDRDREIADHLASKWFPWL